MIEIIDNLSLNELRKITISASRLNQFIGKNNSEISKVIDTSGMIQLDPIDPAGRNHDIYLSSRIENYTKGTFEKDLYTKKRIFEVYFPNLMAVDVAYYSILKNNFIRENLHPYYQDRLKKFTKKYPKAFENILDAIERNGPTNGAELSHLGRATKTTAVWKTSRVSGTGLELLWLLGKIIVVKRDEQFKKFYDLIERYISQDFLTNHDEKKNNKELEIEKFILKQKYQPLIFIGNLTINDKNEINIGKQKKVNIKLLNSSKNKKFYIARIPNTKKGVFLPFNWENFLKNGFDDRIRSICPLDPLIHDRDIANTIFNFDYAWEIYKKPEHRRWGYYVYPLLYQDKFIGRLEAVIKKGETSLKFFNFQKEKSIRINSDHKNALKNLMKRWVIMLGVKDYSTDNTLNFL